MTGLSRFPALPVAGAAAAAALLFPPRVRSLVPLVVAAGIAHGTVGRLVAARACANRLPAGPVQLAVRLLEPGRPGTVGAVSRDPACPGRITLQWPATAPRAASGSALSVSGRWVPRPGRLGRPDGRLLLREAEPAGAIAGPRALVAGSVVERAERLFGARAPMVEALVLGRRDDLDPGLRLAFAQAGLAHLLAISGFHVGVLATWVLLVLRAAGVGRRAATSAAAMASVAYVAFLGWPPPAARAALFACLVTLSRLRQRNVRSEALLGAACLLVLLVDPWAVAELGAWLSAAAVLGLTTATRWSDRAVSRRWGVRMLSASVGATLATAPITAAVLGSVALGGVALNFAAIPVAGVAVPGIVASLVADGLAPALSAPLARGTGLALAALEATARFGAGLPGASLPVEPGARAALPWLLVLGLAVWSISERAAARVALRRAAWTVVAGLWLALAAPPVLGRGESGLTLHLISVGQGDGAVLHTPAGRWIVVDAGPEPLGAVERFLGRQRATRVAILAISHAHADHLGGARALMERFAVERVLEPGVPVADPGYAAFLDEVALEGADYRPVRRGDRWEVDGVRLTALHPDTAWPGWREDLNEDSVVLLVEYGRFRAVFPGDAGLPAEAFLAGTVGCVDLLKVGHHGSRTATGDSWLAELRPRVAVISVGRNRYGHPSPEALGRLAARAIPVWRTDRDGTVTIRADGQGFTVRGRDRETRFASDQRQEESCHVRPP